MDNLNVDVKHKLSNFCYVLTRRKRRGGAQMKTLNKHLKILYLICVVSVQSLALNYATAQDRSENLVKVYKGPMLEVSLDLLASGRSSARFRGGKLDAVSLRILQNFEKDLLADLTLPSIWQEALRSRPLEILISQDASAGFHARVVGPEGIIVDPRLLTTPSARLILEHEIFHVIKRRLGHETMPPWFEEGLAQYFAFFRNFGAVGYPLESFHKNPVVDLREGSYQAESRNHAWYGKSFLFIYYLLSRMDSDRKMREKNFWTLANLNLSTESMGLLEVTTAIFKEFPEFRGMERAWTRDFYLALALNRSHGVFDKRYFLFPTTLSLEWEELRLPQKSDPKVPRFFVAHDQAQRVSHLKAWADYGMEVYLLPNFPSESPKLWDPSLELPTESRASQFFLLWVAE